MIKLYHIIGSDGSLAPSLQPDRPSFFFNPSFFTHTVSCSFYYTLPALDEITETNVTPPAFKMSTSIPTPTPMLESDLTTAARFMYESQIQQATNRFLFLDWPNESAQIALYEASMRQTFNDPSNEMYKITDDSGAMIASLILNRKSYSTGASTVTPTSQPPIDMSALNPTVRPAMRNALIGVQQSMEGIDHMGNYHNACLHW